MEIVSDLHIHSKYSRATSKDLNISSLEKYAKIKGLGLLGTGDFTHPKWILELKSELTEQEKGIYRTKTGFPFVLSGEVSLMYTQDGKGRKVHLVLLAPSFEVVEQINEYLLSKGRTDYDGRPIFGINSIEFVESLKAISDEIEIIPAHCLLPTELIHIDKGLEEISILRRGNKVLTHMGRFQKIKKVYKRPYEGDLISITPSQIKFECKLTPEHPVYAIRSYKGCKNVPHTVCKPTCAYIKRGCKEKFKDYKSEWVMAGDLEVGDIIIFPRYNEIKDRKHIYLNKLFSGFFFEKNTGLIKPKGYSSGVKNIGIKNKIVISKDFCRLIGYYLAEGYVSKNCVGFTFNENEVMYISDLKDLLTRVFGDDIKFYEVKENSKGHSFYVHSRILYDFFKMFYSSKVYLARNKKLPSWFMKLPKEKQRGLILGWWRGDSGYTASKTLMNQMKTIFLRMGIVPSITEITADSVNLRRAKISNTIEGRHITAKSDLFHFHNLSFFNKSDKLLKEIEFKRYKTTIKRRKSWMDNDFVYLPIKKISKTKYRGAVYNLEVEGDNSYVTRSLTVHNCWTPWFGLFGSMSGFDSVKEAFKDQAKHIYALETGLSSDPAMNWQLSSLDKYSLVSFSDLHSYWPWRIGREATIFDIDLSYKNLIKALRTKKGIKATIEVDPGYGKYHFDGHRNCRVSLEPKESIKKSNICPVCLKPLTIGVLHRVEQLADRPEGFKPEGAPGFLSLIPLSEILAKLLDSGIATQKTWKEYNNLIANFQNELNILINAPFEELRKYTSETIAEKIIENRKGKIKIHPGYDGEYGYPVFSEEDIKKEEIKKPSQKGLNEFI